MPLIRSGLFEGSRDWLDKCETSAKIEPDENSKRIQKK
jgi:hypothetical protein